MLHILRDFFWEYVFFTHGFNFYYFIEQWIMMNVHLHWEFNGF